MIQIIRSGDRFREDAGWLLTHWHFSFDHYYDPKNMHWGALRVFNEDYIQPETGFPLHPHANMEIVTYVLSGELTHQDSLGNTTRIGAGELQRMTAGKGIVHAELNAHKSETVHLLQMWVTPRERNLTPGYEQRRFTQADRQGRLLCAVSGKPDAAGISIHQDADFYIALLQAGQQVTHETRSDRYAYLFVVDGELTLNGETLRTGDQARITGEQLLTMKAATPTELVLWDTI